MNRQVLMWSLLIVPWLTIFVMKKSELKRYMPACLFTAVTSGIILQIGYSIQLWYFGDIAFPVVMYGLLAISGLWVLKYTYGRHVLYTIINAVFDLAFAFVIMPWFARIEIFGMGRWSSVFIYCINLVHSQLIYGYQNWQQSVLVQSGTQQGPFKG
jgi:hypothetical protein